MRTRTPLVGLFRILDELEGMATRQNKVKERALAEVRRLSRTKHRERALHELYWDWDEFFTATELAAVFRLHVLELASVAGPKETTANCLLCGAVFKISVPSRSAWLELEREQGANPKWRCCEPCNEKRLAELRVLRRAKGERLTAAHRQAYWRYLQSPQWKETRQKALRRAKNKCQLCGSKTRLNVHHRTYQRIGRESIGDLIVLCRDCHEHHHDV